MAVLIHAQQYWRAYLLNLVFVGLFLATHALAYGDSIATTERHPKIPTGQQLVPAKPHGDQKPDAREWGLMTGDCSCYGLK